MKNIEAVLNGLSLKKTDVDQILNMIDFLLITTDEESFAEGYEDGKAESMEKIYTEAEMEVIRARAHARGMVEQRDSDDYFTAEDMEKQFDVGFTEGQNSMLRSRQIERLQELDQRVWGSREGWEW